MWAGDGSKSSAARLAHDGHRSKGTAKAVLVRGRRLDRTPVVAAAFAAGELSADQVDSTVSRSRGTREAVRPQRRGARRQGPSPAHGRTGQGDHLLAPHADAETNPDGIEPELPTPSLTLSPIDGAVAINGELDPVGGQIVATALDTIADDLAATHPDRDQAQLGRWRWSRWLVGRWPCRPGRSRRGSWPTSLAAKPRSPTCANWPTARSSTQSPRPLRRGVGHPFDPVRRHQAGHRRVVEAHVRRNVRGAIEVHDLHCQHHSGCDEPIEACDVDHIVPVHQGGVTSQDNGRLMCKYHNRIEPQFARPRTRRAERSAAEAAMLRLVRMREVMARWQIFRWERWRS